MYNSKSVAMKQVNYLKNIISKNIPYIYYKKAFKFKEYLYKVNLNARKSLDKAHFLTDT